MKNFILREKDFRESVKNHDWSQYQDSYVALTCSSDAIIPSWAYLLLTVELTPFAKKVVVGDLPLLETVIYQDIINQIDISEYKDKPIIIKGCANKPIPPSAYTLLIEKVKTVAKTIMFGEACSTVPLYKKKSNSIYKLLNLTIDEKTLFISFYMLFFFCFFTKDKKRQHFSIKIS